MKSARRESHPIKSAKHFSYLCASLLLWLPTTMVFADAPEAYPFLQYDKGLRLAQKTGKKIFLYYGRYGCGFCDKTNKESFSNPQVRELYTRHYVLVYVDGEGTRRLKLPSGERITEMELGARLKTLVTPVFMFLDTDGRQILKVPGFQSAEDFLKMDSYINDGHYKSKSFNQYLAQGS